MRPGPEHHSTLIFDLDGTLVDSAPDIASAVNEVLLELGHEIVAEARIRDFVGDGLPRILTRALAEVGGGAPDAALFARFDEFYAARATDATRPYPGVADTLARLAGDGWRMAVATNKGTTLSQVILEALGLASYFAIVAGGDRVPARKPDPRHIQYCLDALGIVAGETVVVGDSENDVKAAKSAGCLCIGVTYGYGNFDGAAPDRLIARMADLPTAIALFQRVPAFFPPSSKT